MRFLSCAIAALLLLALPLRAAPVELAHADPLRDNSWELLRLLPDQLPGGAPNPGCAITLQDARGGLAVSRNAPANPATALLFPLPAVATTDLAGAWPLRLTISPPPHREGRAASYTISVPLPAPGAPPAFRVALPNDVDALRSNIAPPGTRLEILHVSDDDLVNGSPLMFAAVDAIFLPRRLTQNFPEERAAALAAAGPRLLAPEDEEDGLGSLRHLGWVRILGADNAPTPDLLWRFPAGDPHSLADSLLPPLTPIHAGLTRIPGLLDPPAAGVRTRRIVILVPLAAIVLLLLARGLFRRGPLMLAAAALAMLALLGGALRLLQNDAAPAFRRAHWTDGGGGLRIEESLAACAAYFPADLRQRAEPGQILVPLFPSPTEYFQQSATLALDQPVDTQSPTPAGSRAALLEAPLPPRGGIVYLTRWAQSAVGFRATPDMQHPNDTTPAWWVVAGHLVDAAGPLPSTQEALAGPTFPEWFTDQGPTTADLRAWYELRFNATNRYLFSQAPFASPEIITVTRSARE